MLRKALNLTQMANRLYPSATTSKIQQRLLRKDIKKDLLENHMEDINDYQALSTLGVTQQILLLKQNNRHNALLKKIVENSLNSATHPDRRLAFNTLLKEIDTCISENNNAIKACTDNHVKLSDALNLRVEQKNEQIRLIEAEESRKQPSKKRNRDDDNPPTSTSGSYSGNSGGNNDKNNNLNDDEEIFELDEDNSDCKFSALPNITSNFSIFFKQARKLTDEVFVSALKLTS